MVKVDDVVAVIHKLRVPGSTKGVSRVAIKAEFFHTSVTPAQINLALRRGVENGKLTQIKDSFKVPNPKPKPAPRKKAPAKKKAAPKKKKKAPPKKKSEPK